jgi:hypothetical protein
MGILANEIKSISKTFITRKGFWQTHAKCTLAVDHISLTVNQGELFGRPFAPDAQGNFICTADDTRDPGCPVGISRRIMG